MPGRDEPFGECDIRRFDIQLAGGDAGETAGYAFGRQLGGAGYRCGETAGIIAGRD